MKEITLIILKKLCIGFFGEVNAQPQTGIPKNVQNNVGASASSALSEL